MLRVLARITRGGLRQQRLDLRREPRLRLRHPPVAHRPMLRRIRFDLRTVQCDMPQFHEARALTALQHLHEEPGQRRQMPLPERRDGVMIGMLIPGEDPHRHVLVRRALDAP